VTDCWQCFFLLVPQAELVTACWIFFLMFAIFWVCDRLLAMFYWFHKLSERPNFGYAKLLPHPECMTVCWQCFFLLVPQDEWVTACWKYFNPFTSLGLYVSICDSVMYFNLRRFNEYLPNVEI
jgi:hypothetical protein